MPKAPTKNKMNELAKAIKGQNNSNPNTRGINLSNMMDKSWDDLNNLYENTMGSMASIALSTIELAKSACSPENINKIPEDKQKQIGVIMTNYEKDLTALKSALDNIHNLHKDKTGKMKNDQEVIAGIEVIESYSDFSDTITALLLPPSTVLAEIVGAIKDGEGSAEVKELISENNEPEKQNV